MEKSVFERLLAGLKARHELANKSRFDRKIEHDTSFRWHLEQLETLAHSQIDTPLFRYRAKIENKDGQPVLVVRTNIPDSHALFFCDRDGVPIVNPIEYRVTKRDLRSRGEKIISKLREGSMQGVIIGLEDPDFKASIDPTTDFIKGYVSGGSCWTRKGSCWTTNSDGDMKLMDPATPQTPTIDYARRPKSRHLVAEA